MLFNSLITNNGIQYYRFLNKPIEIYMCKFNKR